LLIAAVMKKVILGRYPRLSDGRLIVDVTTTRVADLYNNFDKSAAYAKKELDENLVEYLIESVREIGDEAFAVRFHFAEPATTQLQSRIQTSLHNYFLYLKELETRALLQMLRTAFIFLVVGITILFFSVWVHNLILDEKSVVASVFAEGLTIAAWVSLWEAVAAVLINWRPHRRRIKLCERIARATIFFE
jgi:hypothetical protein